MSKEVVSLSPMPTCTSDVFSPIGSLRIPPLYNQTSASFFLVMQRCWL